ncbi:hypothetical protein PMAYCL1PPCAC_09685, partial [Pristionchus mayeri]
GVQVVGKNLSCSDNSKIVKSSSGISSPSFVCDENSGFYKDGEKIVSKGETITCERKADLQCPEGSTTICLRNRWCIRSDYRSRNIC